MKRNTFNFNKIVSFHHALISSPDVLLTNYNMLKIIN